MSGWWAEQFAKFQLEVSPVISFPAEEFYPRSFSLGLSPSVSMIGSGVSVAELDLSFSSTFGFLGQSYIKTVALDLSPMLGMDAAPISIGAFGLFLSPVIGISGNEFYSSTFTLSLTPSFTALAYVKQIPHPIPWTL